MDVNKELLKFKKRAKHGKNKVRNRLLKAAGVLLMWLCFYIFVNHTSQFEKGECLQSPNHNYLLLIKKVKEDPKKLFLNGGTFFGGFGGAIYQVKRIGGTKFNITDEKLEKGKFTYSYACFDKK